MWSQSTHQDNSPQKFHKYCVIQHKMRQRGVHSPAGNLASSEGSAIVPSADQTHFHHHSRSTLTIIECLLASCGMYYLLVGLH